MVLGAQVFGQQIFFEDFSTCSNSGVTTSGNDNVGGVAWSTTCPGSIAASDYFQCVGGVLEAQDTNSPEAVWSTGPINVSVCVGSEISFEMSETDDMEACADCGGTGSTCIDFVRVEYNLDGAGWVQFGAQTCGLGLTAGNNHIQIGNIAGGGPIGYTSDCVPYGNNVEFRIVCMCWAGSERWRFDNISVDCNDCVLSVKISKITAERKGRTVEINWTTATEFNNEKFNIERSVNGYEWETIGEVAGSGDSQHEINYSFVDQDAHLYAGSVIYYRIKQYDFDGRTSYSKTRSVEIPAIKVFYNFESKAFSVKTTYDTFELENYTFNVYDLAGKLVHSSLESGETIIPWSREGFYIVEIPELNQRQKVVVQ